VGNAGVLSARFWSQRARVSATPDFSRASAADQNPGCVKKNRPSLSCLCPCRAPIPIAAGGCRRLPDSRRFEENSNRKRCAPAAKWRRKVVRWSPQDRSHA